jgi:hypothetical protein
MAAMIGEADAEIPPDTLRLAGTAGERAERGPRLG